MEPLTPNTQGSSDKDQSNGQEKDQEQEQEPTPIDILYRLELCSYLGGSVAKTFESPQSFDVQIVKREAAPKRAKAAFEVITQVAGSIFTTWGIFNPRNKSFTDGGPRPPSSPDEFSDRYPPRTGTTAPAPEVALSKVDKLDDVRIHRKGETRIVVHSELLLALLRYISTYYPEQNMTGTNIMFAEPYPWLLHHLPDLKSLIDKDFSQSGILPPAAEVGMKENDMPGEAKRQLELLLQFLQPTIEDISQPVEKLITRDTPLVTFDTVWYHFRPGTEIYIKTLDMWHAAIVKSCDLKPVESREKKQPVYKVHYWNLSCDGEELGRYGDSDEITAFEGQKEVTALEMFPTKYWDSKDGGDRRRAFIERGRRLYEAVHQGSKEFGYDGNSYFDGENDDDDAKKRKYRGRIIIDIGSARTGGSNLRTGGFAEEPENIKDKVVDVEMDEPVSRGFPWASYEKIKVKEEASLSDHHYFLFSPAVPGFALSEKIWMMFETQSIQDIKAVDDGLTHLFMDPDDLQIIKSLSHRQKQVSRTWDADFIRGKGSGQILLLHGPPGVGKTYTVECIAAAFRRPLLALTIADIGIDEKQIEKELTKWFDLATAWNAVVLIDEADVFLEQRQTRDLARNGLVSVFLRKIEYFQGLLFLTTNRTGQIDDAFESRLHAIIQYKRLDDATRSKIWNGFFDKLKKDKKGQVIVGPKAKKFVLEDESVQKLKWNGREIRNAFQTAVSLAEFEASEDKDFDQDSPIIVESEHFEKVCKMSRSFKDYMWKIKNANEEKRAAGRKDRHDFSEEE